jgi:NAD(P)-dependent dehydrogenase (short-subunit alcohol dehydrogenase family)
MSIVNLSLDGKVALITGGSKGIGRSIALAFAENGADIAIGARGKEALEATAKEIEARGRRSLALPTDVGEEQQLRELYEQTAKQLGGVDILVNNAALFEFQPLEAITPADFERAMRVNVGAALLLSQLCRESMKKRGGGVIIHISSDESLRPSAGIGAYAMTKICLTHLAKHMAVEWGADGIRVLSISPGLVRTEMTQGVCEVIERQGEDCTLNPMNNRIGEPHEIAGFALLAASPAGSYINGGNYVIDGGTQSLPPVKIVE